MELQELVERIARWKARQAGGVVSQDASYAAPMVASEPEIADEAIEAADDIEEEISQEVEAEVVAEDSTSEVTLDQVEPEIED